MRIGLSVAGSVWFLGSGLAFGQTVAPTFSKDVMPILQKNCQTCHRPGEAGPFSMLNYKETRPWAAAMKEVVLRRKMPPWFADPHYGKFSNGHVLSDADIRTIVTWADAKAPEGDPKDLPAPVKWVQGWGIGTPDKVFELPTAYDIPASGVIDYQHVIVPTGFTQDMWVQAAEVRPTDRAVVHHIIAFVREPKSNWFKGEKTGVFFIAPQVKTDAEPTRAHCRVTFWLVTRPGNLQRFCGPVKPSWSKQDRTLCSRCTTRRTVRRPAIRRSWV